MATNLQVNANTQSAVGAFNALASAIASARAQFQQLTAGVSNVNAALSTGTSRLATWANTGVNGFSRLTAAANSSYQLLTKIAGVAEFGFSAILKELDKLQGFQAIMSITTKSVEDADQSYKFLRKTADDLGVQFDTLTSNYAKLVAALPPGTEGLRIAEKTFLGVAKAARTLHSTNADTQLMFYAITQMASKGVVSMEELRRQLGEKLPGIMQIAARAVNTTPELLENAIRKGTVNSIKFLNYFADEMNRTFEDSAAKASVSVSAALNRLTNVWIDFVKQVLDSGAGQSIVNLFDALREKLSDPYVIAAFSNMVKNLGDRLTEMVSKLTADDIRNGFDTFSKGVEMGVKVLQVMVNVLTWIINNAPKAGAVIGAVGGAMALAPAGPWGAVAGAVLGGGGGYALGRSVQPTQKDQQLRSAMDAQAKADAATARYNAAIQRQQDAMFKMNVMIPKLQEFRALNGLTGLDNLFKSQNLNTKTIEDLNKILSSKEFKTDRQKADALMRYAATGSTKLPTLADVLQTSTKKDGSARKMDASFNRAVGLDANFYEEWARYSELFKRGKLDTEQLTKAQAELLAKQPAIESATRLETEARQAANKSTTDYVLNIMRSERAITNLDIALSDDLRLAQLRTEEFEIERRLTEQLNRLREAGVSSPDVEVYRQRNIEIMRATELTQAQNTVVAETADRYQRIILDIRAMQTLLKDPSSGVTLTQVQDRVVMKDSNMQGTGQWINAQIRAVEEYYKIIQLMRKEDLIDDATANQARANSFVQLQKQMTEAYVSAAQIRVEAGSTEWVDVAISALGRLAIGFTNLNAGATQAMGNFFQSFTDGFANSVGRAIVYSENLHDALLNVAREGIATLISALVKLGVQWVVQATLGRSIATASQAAAVATAAAAGTATAMAWAPAAAMVSLASFGANAVPASTGIAATVTLSQTLAALGAVGFRAGGYTGNEPVDQVVGAVHGREFVFDATSVRRIGVNNLEAMRKGTTATRSSVAPAAAAPAPAAAAQTGTQIVNVIDPRMVGDYLMTPNGQQVVINVLRFNSDSVRSIAAEA